MGKIFTGKVISTKMNKTIVVLIERKFRHPIYKKVITKHKNIKVHSEKTNIKEGQTVQIEETKPISKEKHFEIVEKPEESKVIKNK